MAIVNAKEMMLKATAEKYAVGAFNCTNLIQMEAVVEAAVEAKAPLILQVSVAPSKFLSPQVIGAIYKTLAASAPIPMPRLITSAERSVPALMASILVSENASLINPASSSANSSSRFILYPVMASA